MKRRFQAFAFLLPVLMPIHLAAQPVSKSGPSEEQLAAWRSAKTIRIRVDQQSPPDQSLPQLPFEDIIGRLISGIGLRPVGNGAHEDLTLTVKSEGRALGAFYAPSSSGSSNDRGTFLYTGASISGTIEFQAPNSPAYRQAFGYTREPPQQTTKGRNTPSDALCFEAMVGPVFQYSKESEERPCAFLPELLRLVYSTWGSDPLLVALEAFKTLPKSSWFSPVGTVAAFFGEVKETKAVEALLPLVRNEATSSFDSGARRSAIVALGEIADARGVEALLAQIGINSNEGCAAAEALAKIPGTAAVPRLMELLEKDPTDYEANCIAATLGKLAGPAAFDVLSRTYKLVPGEGGIDGLGWTRDARAFGLVVGMLAPEQPIQKRIAAIKALGRLGDARAVEPLAGALDDRNESAVITAVHALATLNDPRAIGPLVHRLQACPARTSDAITGALVKMTGVRAIDKKGFQWRAKQWLDWWRKESKRTKRSL